MKRFLTTTISRPFLVLAPAAHAVDETRLPVGDYKVSTAGPARGYIYLCNQGGGGGGASSQGPWFNGDGTWDATKKLSVDGAIEWPSATFSQRIDGATRTLAGNGLPVGGTTGTFPISSADDVYAYDRNPNTIRAQSLSYSMPSEPEQGRAAVHRWPGRDREERRPDLQRTRRRQPRRGRVGGPGRLRRPPAAERPVPLPLDPALPERGRVEREHSKLVGWAFDGFPIYGKRGEDGEELANNDLDVCHGHTHKVKLDGEKVKTYHYHGTSEYPYTVGCFAARPSRLQTFSNVRR